MTTFTIDQGDQIRQARYIMDGPADRPKTVPECHAMIEGLLDLLGTITGITDAASVSPAEETMKDWFDREMHFAIEAHEAWPGLVREAEDILYGPSFGNDPDEKKYRRAAQLIACRRNTCGGPGTGHDHTA
jgi:hypothetical protein